MVKIGLEIHQRLNTTKLFCRCKGESKPTHRIGRRLNIVTSELFEKDEAALFEQSKNMEFVYHFNPKDICLVELDEEPPLFINEEALTTALSVALKLNMKIFPLLQVMRKIIIDGSAVSGFQRTCLVGIEGKIKDVGIASLSIEEESAGIIEKSPERSEFLLSRLGIPLIEISTKPEIRDGKHAKEIAKSLGMLLRMTGKAMRGIGTIRQDLNISVEGGARVEIKGAQDLDMLEKWVDNEIKRQKNLIEIIKELKKRNAYSSLSFKIYDVSKACKSGFPEKAIKRGEKALAIKLPKHKGILGKELIPNRRYGTELSDYAKQAGVKGLLHSDEDLEKYGIDRKEVEEMLSLREEDGFVIIIDREEKAKKALEFVFKRASMDYVPKEVRKTNKDGTTSFLRPLPGKARMYPETDIPLIETKNYLEKAKEELPMFYEEMLEFLEKDLGNKDLALKLASSPMLSLFLTLRKTTKNKKLLAELLTSTREEEKAVEIIKEIVDLYDRGEITKKAAKLLLELALKEKKKVKAIVEEKGLRKFKKEQLLKILTQYKDVKEIMKKYPYNIEAKELIELIKEEKK